jgi:hypothetical protein
MYVCDIVPLVGFNKWAQWSEMHGMENFKKPVAEFAGNKGILCKK